MKSLRRCLTTLVVCLALGLGPGVLGASAEPDDDRGRHCEHAQGHSHEDRDDRGNGDRGGEQACKAEKNNQGGHDGGKGDKDKGHDDKGHDDEGSDDEAHDDEGAKQDGSPGGHHGRRSDGRARGAQAAPTPTPSPSPNEPAAGSLDLTVRASRVVARVGDEIEYTITVTNTGDADLAGVTILDLVPPELDVVSVPIVEAVEAAQAGLSPRGEDVVWILKTLPAGASVDVSWTGTVTQAGDLEATNLVTATLGDTGAASTGGPGPVTSGGPAARASTTTFLATTTGVAAHRTAPKVMPKRIVTVTRVPTPEVGAGAPLPATAMEVEWLVALALAIALVGMVLLIIGRPPLTVGRGSAGALALLAVVYAVSFIGDSSSTRQPRPSETVEDQVKGKRIFNDDGRPTPTPEPRETTPAGGDGEEAAPVAAPPGESSDEVVIRSVRTVKVPVDAVAIPSGPGTNNLAFTWDEPARTIVQATSSVGPITQAPAYELHTTVNEVGDALEATLTLRNLSDGFIHVRGVLVHEVTGEGVSLSLRSRPIDVILRPRGEVRATFRYLLPSGDYQAGANFLAD